MNSETGRRDGAVLFILAGPRGSGKSTLTRKALRDKTPLFGDEHAESFLGFSREFDRHSDGAQDIIAGRTWVGLPHLPLLQTQHRRPAVLFLHCDLMTLFQVAQCPYEELGDIRTYLPYIDYLMSMGFLQWFDHVVVRTLHVPLAVVAQRHRKRLLEPGRRLASNVARLYDPAQPQDANYACVYRAWERVRNELRAQALARQCRFTEFVSTLEPSAARQPLDARL